MAEKEVNYCKAILDGLVGNIVADYVPETEETSTPEGSTSYDSTSDDVLLEEGFNKFIVQCQARKTDFREEKRPDIMVGDQDPKSLEEGLADESKFNSGANNDPNEELEQQGMIFSDFPESYMGHPEPLQGYNSCGLEGPEVGYQGPSANGGGNYLH